MIDYPLKSNLEPKDDVQLIEHDHWEPQRAPIILGSTGFCTASKLDKCFLTMQSSTGATGAAHNSNCRAGRRLVLPVTEKVQSLADFDVALAKVILH